MKGRWRSALVGLWGAAVAIRVFIVLPRDARGFSAYDAGQLAGGALGLAAAAWALYAFFGGSSRD